MSEIDRLWSNIYEKLSKIEDGWYDGFGRPGSHDDSRGPSKAFLVKLEPVIRGLFDRYPDNLGYCCGYHGGLELEWSDEGTQKDFWLSWDEDTDLIDLNVYARVEGEYESIDYEASKYKDAQDVIATFGLCIQRWSLKR